MVFLGLVVVAHKEVGRYAAVGYDASYGGYALQIVLAGVLAVHQMEYLVGAALCREVYVVAEIGLLGNGVEYVVGHILGVGGGKAHAHIGHRARHKPQQLGEGCGALLALAGGRESIGIDILAEQRHLAEAPVAQVGNLAQDAVDVA